MRGDGSLFFELITHQLRYAFLFVLLLCYPTTIVYYFVRLGGDRWWYTFSYCFFFFDNGLCLYVGEKAYVMWVEGEDGDGEWGRGLCMMGEKQEDDGIEYCLWNGTVYTLPTLCRCLLFRAV